MSSHHEHTYDINTEDEDEDEEVLEEDEYSHSECNKTIDHEPCNDGGDSRDDRNNRVGLNMIFSRSKLIDPKAQWVKEWNRVFLLVCAIGLFVDPLFFLYNFYK